MTLVPAILGAQTQHSVAAQELLNKPRVGNAQVTFTDGRIQKGYISRVTDQFVAFETSARPRVCEDVDLPKMAAVRWLNREFNPAEKAWIWIWASPFVAIAGIVELFPKFPPLNPIRGHWESAARLRGRPQSTLDFTGNSVQYQALTETRGRWSVDQDRLSFDGKPETATPFHFDCGDLVLGAPTNKFRDSRRHTRADPPIIGDWRAPGSSLFLDTDNSAIEQKEEDRSGTFENNRASVKMHWVDSTSPGAAIWVAEIKNRHIVLTIGGAATEYHYVPPATFVD